VFSVLCVFWLTLRLSTPTLCRIVYDPETDTQCTFAQHTMLCVFWLTLRLSTPTLRRTVYDPEIDTQCTFAQHTLLCVFLVDPETEHAYSAQNRV